MAIAYVKELFAANEDAFADGVQSPDFAVPVSAAPAAGNTVVLFWGGKVASATALAPTVTDSKGNTWTVEWVNNGTMVELIAMTDQKVAQLTTADTITIHSGNSQNWNAYVTWVEEFSGLPTTLAVDAFATNTGSAATSYPTGTTATTSQANELVLAFCVTGANQTVSRELGWSAPTTGSQQTGSSTRALSGLATYKIVSATGTMTETFTGPQSPTFAAGILTLGTSTTFIDSPSGTVAAGGSRTEAASRADSGSGSVTTGGSSTEAATRTDSPSGTVSSGGSAVEAATGDDSFSGSVSLSGAPGEAATVADSFGGSIFLGGSVLDAFADFLSGAISATGSTGESFSAADSFSGTITVAGSVSEVWGIIFSDNPSGTVTVTGSKVDAFADFLSGTIVLGGSFADSLTGVDAPSGSVVVGGSKADSLTGVDRPSGTITLSGSKVASLTGADVVTGTIHITGADFEAYLLFVAPADDSLSFAVDSGAALSLSVASADTLTLTANSGDSWSLAVDSGDTLILTPDLP